jgi:hypothetical protein
MSPKTSTGSKPEVFSLSTGIGVRMVQRAFTVLKRIYLSQDVLFCCLLPVNSSFLCHSTATRI